MKEETKINQSQNSSENSEKKRVKPSSKVRDYARYSGMAVQLGITIAIGAYFGRSLDQYFGLERPLLTALFGLLATLTALYALIKGLTK